MDKDDRLTAKEFQACAGVGDWRVLASGASAWFAAPSQAAGAVLVRRVAELTGGGRRPDMDLRTAGVQVRIRQSSGLTAADAELARAISAAAHDLGLTADPAAPQAMELGIDALDPAAVLPFWRAALGYEQQGEDDLVDPMRRDPAIWFQQQDQPRPLRNRLHLDIARPQPLTREGAEAVGGGYARENAAQQATLADAEGNEADVLLAEELGAGTEAADWRVLFGAMTFYPTDSPVLAAELAAAAAALADDAGFPLLVDLRPGGVTIDTGKDQWEDKRFADLARRVQAAARDLGLRADQTPLRFVQVGIDAVDIPAVRNFWRAVLGYEYDPRPGVTDIYDPRRLNPPIFFQQMPASEQTRRQQRNRIHIDVFVPHDQARARIDTALAVGGRIVYEESAPAWWTLADPEGNELDIAVSVGREELWAAGRDAAD